LGELTFQALWRRPIYTQLIEHIELMIFSGVYPLGSKLPSVRDMAQDSAVNPKPCKGLWWNGGRWPHCSMRAS